MVARTARTATVPAVVTVVLAWALALPRLVPNTFGDHGTFVSVAERLFAGDRLYVDVWDNKDPLFYYVLALGRLVSPLADVAVEVLWVLVAGLSVAVIATAAGASRTLALVAGFAGTPLLLTGPAYETGMTHLPGLALLLAATSCAVRSRWLAAGVLVGLLLLTKLILTPVAAAGLLVVALHRRREGGLAGLLRAFAGSLALLALGVGAMWLRGELPGWLDNFRLNADYADGDLAASQYGSVVGHLLRAFPDDGRGAGAVTIAALVVVLVAVPRSWTRPGSTDTQEAAGISATSESGSEPEAAARPRTVAPAVLWDLVVVALLVGVVVIAVTATFPHHAQTLSAAGGFALALVATRLSGTVVRWRAPLLLLLAGYLTAGALHPYVTFTAARGMSTSLQSLQRNSPESAVLDSRPGVRTYARAGTNDVNAHAVGLHGVELVCPRFHQYSLDSAAILDQTAACLPRADALIVDDSVRIQAQEPEWNAYVARVRALVASGYDCVRATGSQVCFRRAP
ncbi:hypothetical protein [Terrabacter aerolatus]|uniref:hypothetical protein n=1 Tax=Terrabacter aerolatus TaxID=422442 RepID=UPI0011BE34C9|nr:hypothetical protein [Terrabacter aerolatus]